LSPGPRWIGVGEMPWLTLTLAALAVVAGLAGVGAVLRDAQRENRRAVERRFAQRAQISAALTQSVFSALGNVSATDLARRFGGPAALVRRHLVAQMQPSHLAYSAVLDAGGAVVARAGAAPRRFPLAENAHARAVLSAVRASARGPVVEYALPFPSGRGRRVLVEGIPVQLMRAFLNNYLARLPNPDGSVLAVMDAAGVVLARIGPQGRPASTGRPCGPIRASTTPAASMTARTEPSGLGRRAR